MISPLPRSLPPSELDVLFKNPGPAWRGKPFWSWNGKLDNGELLRQVDVMKEMGFGGFFMHSRTGLVTEYLGEEWFGLINACADKGEAQGMEAWLYDEDRWPSGLAGGLVTRHPEFRMKHLCLEVMPASEFRWEEGIAAAFTAEGLKGVDVGPCERFQAPQIPEAGKTVLAFRVREMNRSSFYNGYTYVDTLMRGATERFLELTHERYRQKCGDRLGRSIQGIFTDEPHRGTLMSTFGRHAENGDWAVPYTGELFNEFRGAFGYSLEDRLPELFLRPGGKKTSRVKWQFVELLQRLFLKNFAKPYRDWCRGHGLAATGHILHEDSLSAQVAMSGSVMRYYEHLDLPGIDVLGEGNRNYWIVKQLASAARQLGKPWMLSELYGCTGWQMTFEGHKAVGDWQALFGINLRCHHLSWYTMEGEAKRDYPASILHQSGWWREYGAVEDYFSRLHVVLSRGEPACELLVLNPVESLWCQIHPGWCAHLSAKEPGLVRLEEQYRQVFHWLQGGWIDFDYGDEELLSRHASIESAPEGAPLLRVGEARYRRVLIAGMATLRSTTCEILERFRRAGGELIFAGEAPALVEGETDPRPAALADSAARVAFTESALREACRPTALPQLELSVEDGRDPVKDVFAQLRRDGKDDYLVIMNMDRAKEYPALRVKLPVWGTVEEWNCRDGERTIVRGEPGWVDFTTRLAATGERVFVIREKESAEKSPPVERPTPQDAKIDSGKNAPVLLHGPWAYTLDEPNVLVLDHAQLRTDGPWSPRDEILKIDRLARDRFGLPRRAGDMIQPWFAAKTPPQSLGPLELRYAFEVAEIPTHPIELVLENPGAFRVAINGTPLPTPPGGPWWIDIALRRFPVPPGAMKLGRNEIALSCEFRADLNLEAIYLLGNFGVDTGTAVATLGRLPDKLLPAPLSGQGLPFYSGAVTYRLGILPRAAAGPKCLLRFPAFGAALLKVNGRVCAFPPYEVDIALPIDSGEEIKVEAVLTRRNTFGPLHQIPLLPASYGPPSWVTTGEAFTADYQLVPSGILRAPECVWG